MGVYSCGQCWPFTVGRLLQDNIRETVRKAEVTWYWCQKIRKHDYPHLSEHEKLSHLSSFASPCIALSFSPPTCPSETQLVFCQMLPSLRLKSRRVEMVSDEYLLFYTGEPS